MAFAVSASLCVASLAVDRVKEPGAAPAHYTHLRGVSLSPQAESLMRIAVAGFLHESNTFNPLPADRAAFVEQGLAVGDALLAEWRDAHHEVGGFLESAGTLGFEPLPLIVAWAIPAGPVCDDVFDEVVATIVAGLQRHRPDGLLLALHGAMVTPSYPDADAEVLARIRAAVGPAFPLAATFDLHGNLPPRLAGLCDLAVAYRTNPHVDQRDCGQRAAGLLVRQIRGEIHPRLALARPVMRINIMKQDTAQEPLAGFMQRVRQVEEQPGLLAASLLPGFVYADVPHAGPAVVVVADGDRGRAQAEADRLAGELFLARALFEARLPNAAEAVRLALLAQRLPVVLVDPGDNVGGGSAGDGTVVLRELLRQGATRTVVCLYAPDEVRACQAAGAGAELSLHVGGKVDRLHGDPVAVTGRVRRLHDGTYVEPEVRHGGKRLNHMGSTALLELPGENLLVLTSLRHPPFSLGALSCLGIRPAEQRVLVVKAAIAYKAAYGPVAGTVIEADTPGLTAINPTARA
jgi:microcystin degradation protein MlrC